MNKKNLIIAIVVPLVLAAIIARIMTPSPESAFMHKLNKYAKLDKACWDLQIGSQKFKQCKFNDEYYAKFYNNGEVLLINTNAGELIFGTDYVAVSSTISDSKNAGSLFWLDKLTTKDVEPGSVVRVKDAEGDVYDAKLNDGSSITVKFYKGLVSEIQYNGISTIEGLVSLGEKPKVSSSITVLADNYQQNIDLPEDFVLLKGIKKLSVNDFKTYMLMSDEELEDDDEDILDLKYAYLGKLSASEDDIDAGAMLEEEEDDFDEEDDENVESGHFEFLSDDDLIF